uniref:Uncharacterized protein n=1 Tax=Haptolina ericina TaxID=156174 RepID=A0A7S3C5K8_9EUKA
MTLTDLRSQLATATKRQSCGSALALPNCNSEGASSPAASSPSAAMEEDQLRGEVDDLKEQCEVLQTDLMQKESDTQHLRRLLHTAREQHQKERAHVSRLRGMLGASVRSSCLALDDRARKSTQLRIQRETQPVPAALQTDAPPPPLAADDDSSFDVTPTYPSRTGQSQQHTEDFDDDDSDGDDDEWQQEGAAAAAPNPAAAPTSEGSDDDSGTLSSADATSAEEGEEGEEGESDREVDKTVFGAKSVSV